MKCPNCGTELGLTEDESMYLCPQCNKKYKRSVKVEPTVKAETPKPPEPDEDVDDEAPQPKKKKLFTLLVDVLLKKQGTKQEKRKAYGFVFLIILLLIGGVAGYTYLKASASEKKTIKKEETTAVTETETEEPDTQESPIVQTAPATPDPIIIEVPVASSEEPETETVSENETEVAEQLIIIPEDLENIQADMKITSVSGNEATADVYWQTYVAEEAVLAASPGDQIPGTNGTNYTVADTQEMMDYLKMSSWPGFDDLTTRSDIVLRVDIDKKQKKYYAIGKSQEGFCPLHRTEENDFAPIYYVLAENKPYQISEDVQTVFGMVNESDMLIHGTVKDGVLLYFEQE